MQMLFIGEKALKDVVVDDWVWLMGAYKVQLLEITPSLAAVGWW